ncbi:MAG: immune inhibitor A [Caldilineales bacterium]|nr:immune inhibitor A [Caldilineales bacterium]
MNHRHHHSRLWAGLSLLVILALLIAAIPVFAAPTSGGDEIVQVQKTAGVTPKQFAPKDQPDPVAYRQRRANEKAILRGDSAGAQTLSGEGKLLVLLLDFAGTDVVTWDPGDQWDPYGKAEEVEFENFGDCSSIITQTMTFTYTPTLHGEVLAPDTADHAYKGEEPTRSFGLYAPDTSQQHFEDLIFGDGVSFSYQALNGEQVNIDVDESLRTYYEKLSRNQYTISGDVIGWIPLPHSLAWYGADLCPGALSQTVQNAGGADGWYGYNPDVETHPRTDYGTPATAIMDAVDWINTTMPDFDWSNYDGNGDGVVDTIVVVTAGIDEANRGSEIDEMAIWPHSSGVDYCADPGPDDQCDTDDDIRTGAYIFQGETTGAATFTHEFGHRLGADDLYSYGYGETSAGIWSNMSDDRGHGTPWDSGSVGMDPWHMLGWGWLNPLIVDYDDPALEVMLTQAADRADGMHDSLVVRLPDQSWAVEEPHSGEGMWFGNRDDLMNNLLYHPIDLTGVPAGATGLELTYWTKYDIEEGWDFGFTQVSTDQGATWTSLANANTTSDHDPAAIGYVVANLPGLTGHIDDWTQQAFGLSAYAGQQIWLGFRYATDWATLGVGWWVDDIAVKDGNNTIFSDDVESGMDDWVADPDEDGWYISNGVFEYPHYYIFEWRNDAGIDHNLAVGRCDVESWGLVGWYINDQKYTANEIYDYVSDVPSFGPKGKALVIDSHPDPLRDASSTVAHNPRGNTAYRCYGMRDAAFGLDELPAFYVTQPPTNPTRWGNPAFEYPAQPAVSAFHDSMGYYPGLEYTNIRPTDDPRGPRNFWVAKERDASVVIPARETYGVAPSNYDGSGFLQWMPEENSYFGFWTAEPGTGNPGDTWAQYGVHLQVVDKADDGSWGKVKFWNASYDYDGAVTETPSKTPLMYGDTVDVHVNATNIGSRVDSTVVVLLDPYVDFVSAYGGAYPLTMGALSQLAASNHLDLNLATAAASAEVDDVVAVAWHKNPVMVGDVIDFGFIARVNSYDGYVHHDAVFYDEAFADVTITGDTLEIYDDGLRTVELPLMYDGWVNGGAGGANYNDYAALIARATGLDNVLLTFDRSALPEGAEVHHASLSLMYRGQSGAVGKSLTAWNVNAYDPMTVTYDTAPLAYNPGAPVAVPGAAGSVSFDVASQVMAWDAAGAADADGMGQLAVSASGPLGRVIFDSLESYQASPATLEVTYLP